MISLPTARSQGILSGTALPPQPQIDPQSGLVFMPDDLPHDVIVARFMSLNSALAYFRQPRSLARRR